MRRSRSDGYYLKLWDTTEVLRDVRSLSNRIIKENQPYLHVEGVTGVPWYFIGVIHMMEASGNQRKQILNGQLWNEKTTIVPKGRGPWPTWEASAIEGIEDYRGKADWSIPSILRRLEGYNGWGYAGGPAKRDSRNKVIKEDGFTLRWPAVNSPYLWSCTNHGKGVGKYVSDGRYKPDFVSKQVGAVCILKALESQGVSMSGTVRPVVSYGSKSLTNAIRVQQLLNSINNSLPSKLFERLAADGKPGRKTSDAFKVVFGNYLKGDPRCG